ncbi:hypothetical protein LRA02_05680 [Lentilactobacillus rapi]|uniref:Uncharacterized protein n=1 Tax=Lentilactobacillus rapi TaxID=481723 RepID=A0A512PKH1_9LACO|nr:hypothetical protein LRA02_05680 [Lentilactobacillus rapi]
MINGVHGVIPLNDGLTESPALQSNNEWRRTFQPMVFVAIRIEASIKPRTKA